MEFRHMLLISLAVLAQSLIAKPLNEAVPGTNKMSLNLTVGSLVSTHTQKFFD